MATARILACNARLGGATPAAFSPSPRGTASLYRKDLSYLRKRLRFSTEHSPPVTALRIRALSSTDEGSEPVGTEAAAVGSIGVVEAMTGKDVVESSYTPTVDDGIGGNSSGNLGRGDGGRGGGGGGGGDSSNEGSKPLSMSQKLTLAYAGLLGFGGFMGFLKSGSIKSAFTGGAAAFVLFNVYSQLPVNPVAASSLGAAISLLLLIVMGSRFMKTKKFFPGGVVSLMSFVMTGGYIHGIMRSSHA